MVRQGPHAPRYLTLRPYSSLRPPLQPPVLLRSRLSTATASCVGTPLSPTDGILPTVESDDRARPSREQVAAGDTIITSPAPLPCPPSPRRPRHRTWPCRARIHTARRTRLRLGCVTASGDRDYRCPGHPSPPRPLRAHRIGARVAGRLLTTTPYSDGPQPTGASVPARVTGRGPLASRPSRNDRDGPSPPGDAAPPVVSPSPPV